MRFFLSCRPSCNRKIPALWGGMCRQLTTARSSVLRPSIRNLVVAKSFEPKPSSSDSRKRSFLWIHAELQRERYFFTSCEKLAEAKNEKESKDDFHKDQATSEPVSITSLSSLSQNNNDQVSTAFPLLQVHSNTTTTTTTSSSRHVNDWQEILEPHDMLYPPESDLAKDIYSPELHLASAPTDWTGYEPATRLWEELAAQIGVTGAPISVAHYMRLCLTHPKHGYYTRGTTASVDEFDTMDHDLDPEKNKNEKDHNDLAIGGDFVTAPEISQIFGESLGIWMILTGQQQGLFPMGAKSGKAWQYLEIGPGKGSLLVDLLRFWGRMAQGDVIGPNAIPQVIHLIELSPRLKQVQKQKLQEDLGDKFNFDFVDYGGAVFSKKPETDQIRKDGDSKRTVTIYWHDTLISFKLWQDQHKLYLPTFCICQEFMDALPVYVFEKSAEGWRERLVDVALREDILKQEEDRFGLTSSNNKEQSAEKLRLRIVLAPEVTRRTKALLQLNDKTGLTPYEEEIGQEAPIGSVVEVNPEATFMTQDLAKIVAAQGGGTLIIDYGQEGTRDTIRAFGSHKQLHFLSRPGQVDITADVDFGALKHAVNNMVGQNNSVGKKRDDAKENTDEERPKARAYGPVGQGLFLMSMGVKDRVLQLAENATEEEGDALYHAMVRLCDPTEMGERFKVLAIIPAIQRFGMPQPPPGF